MRASRLFHNMYTHYRINLRILKYPKVEILLDLVFCVFLNICKLSPLNSHIKED